jgi:hypothetical protein
MTTRTLFTAVAIATLSLLAACGGGDVNDDDQAEGAVTAQNTGGIGGSGLTTQGRGGIGGSGLTTQGTGGIGGSGLTTQGTGGIGGSGASTH